MPNLWQRACTATYQNKADVAVVVKSCTTKGGHIRYYFQFPVQQIY